MLTLFICKKTHFCGPVITEWIINSLMFGVRYSIVNNWSAGGLVCFHRSACLLKKHLSPGAMFTQFGNILNRLSKQTIHGEERVVVICVDQGENAAMAFDCKLWISVKLFIHKVVYLMFLNHILIFLNKFRVEKKNEVDYYRCFFIETVLSTVVFIPNCIT